MIPYMIYTIGTSEIFSINLKTLECFGPLTESDFEGSIRSYDNLYIDTVLDNDDGFLNLPNIGGDTEIKIKKSFVAVGILLND